MSGPDCARQSEAVAKATGLRWCRRGNHPDRSKGSYYTNGSGQRCWQCDACAEKYRQIQQQQRQRTGGNAMAAKPNRDPAAIESVLNGQQEATSNLAGNVFTGRQTLASPKTPPVWSEPKADMSAASQTRSRRQDQPMPGDLVLDDGVPLPRPRVREGVYKPVMSTMRVGQSFFVARTRKTTMSAATTYRRELAPKQFQVQWRDVGQDEKYPTQSGYRVWRTK